MKKLIVAFALFLSLGAFFIVAGCDNTNGPEGNCDHANSFSAWTTVKEATCTEDGEQERVCSKCNYKDTRPVSATGHKWSKEKQTAKKATCKETGVKAYVCERCDATKDEETIPTTEHDFGEWTDSVAPTCTEPGERIRTCSICGEVRKNAVPAIDHDFNDPNPETKAATCTEDGTLTYHCIHEGCTETVVVDIKSPGHSWQDVANRVEPTCTEEGSVDQECSVCHATQHATLQATGHKYQRNVTKAATCTEDGTAVDVCSACDDEKDVTLPKMGHLFDEYYTIDVVPTDTAAGTMSYHCLHEGCTEHKDEKSFTKTEKIRYSFSIVRESGAGLLGSMVMRIYNDKGEKVAETQGNVVSVDIEMGTYTAKVVNLPAGYVLDQESITLSTERLHADFKLTTKINAAQEGKIYDYTAGSVLRNHKIHIVGSKPEEDYDVTVSDLLSKYKAIFINLYFTTCTPCMSEIQEMVDAYNTVSPTGKIFGEEVAMIMLSEPTKGDTIDRVRDFKNRPYAYSKLMEYKGVLPFMMAFDEDLINNLRTPSDPATYIIDCEGVIVYKNIGPLEKDYFTGIMTDCGLNLYFNLHPEEAPEAKSDAETFTVPEAILPERKH